LLCPAPSVHTAFMRFPIDAVFLDRDLVVVKVVRALAPWRAASARRARAVLELGVGESARRGIRVGDRLARVGDDEMPDGPMGAEPASPLHPIEGRREPLMAGGGGRGDRLLLVSRDRRFRAVMAALLSARGFTVMMSTRYADIPEDALPPADVFVIDADESLPEAVRDGREPKLTARKVAVVFVSDDDGDGRNAAARVIPKWQSFEQLCDEIEAARSRTLAEAAARRRDAGRRGRSPR